MNKNWPFGKREKLKKKKSKKQIWLGSCLHKLHDIDQFVCYIQILLEAVFGKGIHGDIAVDDLYFSNEEDCPTTYGNGKQYHFVLLYYIC